MASSYDDLIKNAQPPGQGFNPFDDSGSSGDQTPSSWADVGKPPSPAKEPDYGNMGWGDVAKEGISNLPTSTWNNLKAIPEAVMNPGPTWEGIKQLGTGIASKTEGLFENQDHDQKAKDEAMLNALIEPYTSVAGFKKALATDPFSVLTTAALPVSFGGSGIVKGAEEIGKIGDLAKVAMMPVKGAGRIVQGAGLAMDPTNAAITTAGAATRWGAKAAQTMQAGAAGVPGYTMKKAFDAGASSGAAAPALKSAFNDFATGKGDPVAFSRVISKAADADKQAAISGWAKNKQGYIAANSGDVPLDPIRNAIDDFRSTQLGNRWLYTSGPMAEAHSALDHVENLINNHYNFPTGSPERSVQGIDLLKQQIGGLASQSSGLTNNALWAAYHGAKKAIDSKAPGYTDLMEQYQAIQDGLNNIVKTMGTGSKTAANAELAKFIRGQKTPQGQQIIERLAQQNPTIPYMVAGATLHDAIAQGGSGLVEKGSAPFHFFNIGRALLSGNPMDAVGATGAMAGQFTLQSPRAMGALNYGLGKASRYGSVTKKLAFPVTGVRRRMAMPVLMNDQKEQAAQAAQDSQQNPPQDFNPFESSGGRVERASGGKVDDVESAANRLIAAAEKAKAAHGQDTKPLLNVPDNAIASALSVANEAI